MNAALLALALSTVSTSKIGVVVLGDDAASQTILAACPATVVASLVVGRNFGTALTTYRANCAGGTVVARLDAAIVTTPSPAVDATSYWNTLGLPLVIGMGVAADWVEGPTVSYASSADLATFWSTLADSINASSFRPIVGRIDASLATSAFCPTATAMAAKGYTWGWSWLARSPTFTQDPTTESATTLGFRTVATTCNIGAVPLFLTEAGPTGQPWPAGDVSWLTWLDGQIQGEAQAAAAFEAGGTVAPTLDPVAAALAAYLVSPQSPDGGADGGADAGTSGITGGGTPGAPDGPPGPGPSSTCSTSGAGIGLLALAPVLAILRRRRRA